MASSDFESSDSEDELELLSTLDSLEVEADHQQQLHQVQLLADKRNQSASMIQQTWRAYHQAKLHRMTENINLLHSVRANPFDVSRASDFTGDENEEEERTDTTTPLSPRQDVPEDRSKLRHSLLIDEDDIASLPSPSDEPSFHMAAVAAQLYSLDSREQHIDEVFTTRNVKEKVHEEEDPLNGSHGDADIKQLLTNVYPSMQICFEVGGNERKQPVAENGSESGRESRGAADGASTGSPELQEGIDEEFERASTPFQADRGFHGDDLKSDLEPGLSGSQPVSLSTPTQEMEWIVDDDEDSCTSVEFGLQMWRRGERQLTATQLHCLNVSQLCALRDELQLLVATASNELVTLLTMRDSLACQRDEYNVFFETYSRQMETNYRKASGCEAPHTIEKKKKPWMNFLTKS